jgi:hypothetical protein
MNDSIFETIKALLGPDSNYTVYDNDILIHINSVLSTLTQLGIGPSSGFRVTGPIETWSEFLGDRSDIDSVKTYVYLKVKLIFDPPSNSSVAKAYEETCKELEWRMNVAVEPVGDGG